MGIDRGARGIGRLGRRWAVLAAALALAGCGARDAAKSDAPVLTAADAAAAEDGARVFMQSVARDITHDGPTAWLKYFETSPAFFMAVNGQLAFANNAAATAGTQAFASTNKSIELTWGDDVRVDPLTPELAAVGASWREIQEDTAGHRAEEKGYFTALVENRGGHWQIRDAHWSSPVEPTPAH
jgi:hypothetical protein